MEPMPLSKKVKRRLRELAGIAYERELRAALKPVEQALADMHAGKCDAFAVSEVIHQFHQKPARDLWVQYNRMDPEFSITGALLDNIISPEEMPAEVRQWFIERAELLRKVRSSDADENDAIDEEKMSKKKSHRGSDIHSLIRDVHPEDIIYCSFIEEESYLAECADALGKKLTDMAGSYVETWYNLSGNRSGFHDGLEKEDDAIPFDTESLSYLFHFVSSDNDETIYKREYEESGGATQIADVRAGVAVYISYLAPVAFLHFREIGRDEEGETIPFIDHPNQLEPDNELGLAGAEDFLKYASPALRKELERIKQKVEEALKQFKIRIITREEAKQTCPWLTHDEEVLVSDSPTVFEALFYRCI
jgi:hypothetical protein